MSIYHYIGTGRAKCNCCGKLIPKGKSGLDISDGTHFPFKLCQVCVVKALFNLKTKQQIEQALAIGSMTE
jgi:hypothetical protein